jgi:hypothetical protein
MGQRLGLRDRSGEQKPQELASSLATLRNVTPMEGRRKLCTIASHPDCQAIAGNASKRGRRYSTAHGWIVRRGVTISIAAAPSFLSSTTMCMSAFKSAKTRL